MEQKEQKHAQAMLNSLVRQRDSALNGLAQAEAQLELTNQELQECKKELEDLRGDKSPVEKNPDAPEGSILKNEVGQESLSPDQ